MTEDIKSLSAMFAALKSINFFLHAEYGIRFEAPLTDNGPEMASPKNTHHHPMERMLQNWASSIATPDPTGPRPTARWSGSGVP